MLETTTHSAPTTRLDWRQTLTCGDIVSFRFPVEGAGEIPKKRPCIVLEITLIGCKRFALLAYGTSSDTQANRGCELRLNAPAARASGLHCATRFVGTRRILVTLDHPGFVICKATGAPQIGRLTPNAIPQLNAVRRRIHAEAEIGADRRVARRKYYLRRHPAKPSDFTVEHRTPRRRRAADQA